MFTKSICCTIFALSAFLIITPVQAQEGEKPTEPPVKEEPAPQPKPDRLATEIWLTDGVTTVKVPRAELGFSLASEQPVAFAIDGNKLVNSLKAIAPQFQHDAIDAVPTVYKGQFRLSPGSYARALNAAETATKIATAVKENPATIRFNVILTKTPPKVTAEKFVGIDGVLSTFRTTATSSSNRNTNIRLAIEAIHGTLLQPGETFSLNKIVGERTVARGFKSAPVFVNAEKVEGIGGGVSQVTGTLFNAAALAGLKIDEVNPHSRPVAYLALGRDATVAYGTKDLKFTNTTKFPVYITYTFKGRTLTATLYGKKVSGRTVSLRPRVQRLGAGKINTQLYRVIKDNGQVVTQERLFRHAYRWKP